jgi:hypothetical protein
MDREILLITGGQRSGKSSYGEKLALEWSPHPIYLATSRVWDDEHAERIAQHKARRKSQWETIEEEKTLSKHDLTGRVVLIDCVTLWATNFFYDSQGDVQGSLTALKEEFDRFTQPLARYIFVTNEIGLGSMSTNALQRRFADLQGWLNQYIAARADHVVLMVAGLPMKVK